MRRLRAVDVAREAIARVERLNPDLNAIIGFDPAATLAEAAEVDRRLDAGEVLPMAGVPFTAKDNLWVGGRRVSQGSRLFEDFVAPRDAWAVARWRALGAVLLGITNCSEFACKGVTTNPLHGWTRHPMNPALTPGGSSGGAVAALGAGLGLLALGTDAGGSTRRPAAHCGLVGLKPSSGLIPHPWGFAEPNYGQSVIGVMALDVADCAWAFDTLVAFDAADPAGVPVRVANLSSIWTVTYTRPARYNWLLQFYLREHGLALSWVGTGRLIFGLDWSDDDFEAMAERFVAAARSMQADGWWDGPETSNRSIRRGLLAEMLRRRF